MLTITHLKTDNIPDPTQAELDAQIALGNYPPGTTLADIVLSSDWNNDHAVVGTIDQDQNNVAVDGVTITGDGTPGDPLVANVGISDGDKGDITVSSSGTVWTIDAGAVDNGKVAAGIDAAKLADGSVSNTEYQYLNGVTSGIQSQLDAKQVQLNGTGFVKASGTSITYDNSTYLTTASAAATYVPYTGATSSVDLGSQTLTTTGVARTGYIGLGIAAVSSQGITNALGTATDKGVVVIGAASHSGNLAEFQANGGTAVVTVGPPTLPGNSATINHLRIAATLPSTLSATANAFSHLITTAGSSSQAINAFNCQLIAGYTGSSATRTAQFLNTVVGTGATYAASGTTNSYRLNNANFCTTNLTQGATATGINCGSMNVAAASTVANYAVWNSATATGTTPALNVASANFALNATTNCAGLFALADYSTSAPTFTNAALIADNGATTGDIFVARDNGTAVFQIQNGAKINIYATNTPAGTTGNRTIDRPSGKVNIAAAGTNVTVTNSLCTTASIVIATLLTNDATATIKNVVPGAGSFVVTLGAAATAEVSIGFLIIN